MSTMLGDEEQTLLDLSNELEEVTGRMRRAVIDMVHRARDKIHEAAAKELDLRRKQQELEQQQLIEQLDNMQALNVKHMQKIENQQEYADKLLAILYNIRGRRKERDLLRKCIRAWHSIIARDTWVNVMGDYLINQRNNKTLRRAFMGWRNDAGRTRRDRRLENITTTHEAEIHRMKADSDLTISALKVELLGCKDQIARGNEERAILEERLKAAVMRGMCALNAEATMVLRGMAGQSQQHMMAMNENMPPPPQQQQQQPQFQQQQMMNTTNNNNVNPYNYYQQQQNQNQPQYQYQQQQQPSASYTDQLLSMQGSINNQLNQYTNPSSNNNYNNVNNNNSSSFNNNNSNDGSRSFNNNSSSYTNVPNNNNNNNNANSRPPQSRSLSQTPTDAGLPPRGSGVGSRGGSQQRPTSTTNSNSGAGGGGLVSFNADHPAYGNNNNTSGGNFQQRPLTASNRSTPSRR